MSKAVPNVPPNNIGAKVENPRKEFFVRMNRDDLDIVGPLSYAHANAQARFLSKKEDGIGLSEIFVKVGERDGDPILAQSVTRVVAIYARGKLILTGNTAEYHSKVGLPVAP